jgi:hypothetical protein
MITVPRTCSPFPYRCDGVRLRGTKATNGPTVLTPDETRMDIKQRWNDADSLKNLSHCQGRPGNDSGPPWWEAGDNRLWYDTAYPFTTRHSRFNNFCQYKTHRKIDYTIQLVAVRRYADFLGWYTKATGSCISTPTPEPHKARAVTWHIRNLENRTATTAQLEGKLETQLRRKELACQFLASWFLVLSYWWLKGDPSVHKTTEQLT